jgi:hypothetical protein
MDARWVESSDTRALTPDAPDPPAGAETGGQASPDQPEFDPLADLDGPDAPDFEPASHLDRMPVWAEGGPTHGRGIDADGTVYELRSGDRKADGYVEMVNQHMREIGVIPPHGSLTVDSDVEMKFAARMRDEGIQDAILVINNPRGPCVGRLACDELLPEMLVEGSTLSVHWPDSRQKTYEGNAD